MKGLTAAGRPIQTPQPLAFLDVPWTPRRDELVFAAPKRPRARVSSNVLVWEDYATYFGV